MSRTLILGGTTKAATTALFAHLARHPRVSPAVLKEPRFFLDPDYPLDRPVPFEGGPAAYDALFPPRPEPCVRLEATPDYLHSPGTAARLRAALPEALLLFSLRDPIERLVSWYRFARGAARLPADMGLADYVARQMARPGGEQPFRALAQGHYVEDLGRYLERFPPRQVRVVFHEDLVRDPATEVAGILRFAGLEPEPLAGTPFEPRNPTRAVRSPELHRRYVRLAYHLRNWTLGRPRLFGALRRAHAVVRPLYWNLNARRGDGARAERVEPDAALRERLVAHYAPSVERLAEVLGRRPPWPSFEPSAARAERSESSA